MPFPFALDLAGAKDKSLSKLLLSSARQYLRDFGEVLDVVLDTTARSLCVDLLPVGERESIRVELTGYGLVTDGDGRGWLTYEGLSVSRPWLALVAAKVLPDRRVRLPAGIPLGLLQTIL